MLPDRGIGHACQRANRLGSSPLMERCLIRQRLSAKAMRRLEAKERWQSLTEFQEQKEKPAHGSLVSIYRAQVSLGLIKPDFHPQARFFNHLQTDADYINYFLFFFHDWLHTLTRSPFNFLGELKLMSALVANMSYPGFEVYGICGMVKKLVMYMLQQPCDVVITSDRFVYAAMRSLCSGYSSGRKLDSFLGFDFDSAANMTLKAFVGRHRLVVSD